MHKKVRAEPAPCRGFFTVPMLEVNFRVGSAIHGIDPDRDEAPQLEKWFRDHPPIREMSEEEKSRLATRGRDALKRLRENRTGA
jgi:hypothetical protein